MENEPKQPATFEEAVALGFEPIDDISSFLAERVGISSEAFSSERENMLAHSRQGRCSTAPIGSPCFDFCYSNGVRILGYCGPSRLCDRFVHTSCPPY